MSKPRTRVFLALGPSDLRRLDEDGRFTPGGGSGYAVTARLTGAMPTADEEDLEYAALCDASDASLAAQVVAGAAPSQVRRLVAAADVPVADIVAEVDGAGRALESAVGLAGEVRLKDVASFHVGELGGDDDEELSWYDVSELAVILSLPG